MVDRVGQQIGNYRLIRLLGQGGFSSVYLGEDTRLRKQVAIRVLGRREDAQRFLDEVRAQALLTHPNIVKILEFGLEGDTPFVIETYAPNGTLRQRHPKGTQLPLDTIIPYVRQVASALDYAHAQEIIHRDVKPENMLIGPNNEILLSDFGIAVTATGISSPTITGPVAGSAAYMAPEQIRGKPRPASDQYSLGIVVYEWLSGKPPFQGSFMDMAYQHISTPPPFLREKVPGIPPAVEQVVMIALAKDPVQRFDSVETFANALREAHLASSAVLPATLPIKEAILSGSFGRKTLGAKALTIGRVEGNGLVIRDREVSRRQAEIRPAGQGYSIIDLDSMNGTYVNEQRIPSQTPYLLKTGDTIRMGKSKMTYEGSEMPGSTREGPATPIVSSKEVAPGSASPPAVGTGMLSTKVDEALEGDQEFISRAFEASAPAAPATPDLPASASSVPWVGEPTRNERLPATPDLPASASSAAENLRAAPRPPVGEEIELSLFAIASVKLEEGDIALVGKTYTAQAGVSREKPEDFWAAPFNMVVKSVKEPITFDILLHESENIELITNWHRRLLYRPDDVEPQLATFRFQVVTPGKSLLVIDFYHERRWLRTMRFEFDAVEQSQHVPVSSEV